MTTKAPEQFPSEFGKIVNLPSTESPEEVAEIEQKIALLQETDITLTLNQELISTLKSQADFKRVPFDKYLIDVLAEKANVRIGEAVIGGPSILSGTKCAEVTGPSFATNF